MIETTYDETGYPETPDTPKESHPIDRIHIGRYKKPDKVGYIGFIEPEDKTWVLFFGLDGKPSVYYSECEPDGAGIDSSRVDLR